MKMQARRASNASFVARIIARWATIGLSAKMAILVVIGTISMIGLFAYLGTAALSENTQRNLQERAVLAQMTASYIDGLLDNVEDVLTYTAKEDWPDPVNVDATLGQTFQRLNFFASNVYLVDQNGSVIASKPSTSAAASFKDITPVIAVLNGINFSVSHVPQPIESLGSSVIAAAPIRDGSGQVTGALVATLVFTTPNTRAFAYPIGLGQTGYMDLIALNGQILASTRRERVGGESDHGFSLMGMIRDHRQSVSACHNCHEQPEQVQPRPEMLAFAPLEKAQWGVTVRQSEEEVFAPTRLLQLRIYALMALMLGGALALVFLTTRSIIVPVQALTVAARRIADGDLDSPQEAYGENEIGELARAFNEMRVRLKESNEKIQAFNRELDGRVQERTAAYQAAAKENSRLYQELQEKEKIRGELLHHAISAQEDERKRIARELHDETSQGLAALMVGLDTVQIASTQNISKASIHVQSCKSIADNLLKNIHRIIADLRPTLLDDLGLVPAIAWYGEQRLKTSGIAFHMDEIGITSRLEPALEAVLFRIAQEAITNAARYAKASSVTVRLKSEPGHITLQIADDGVGFDPAAMNLAQSHGQGLGLRGMQERAEIIGGALRIESVPWQGTTIIVSVPVIEREVSYA